jgi:hypothetical protein
MIVTGTTAVISEFVNSLIVSLKTGIRKSETLRINLLFVNENIKICTSHMKAIL